MNRRRELGQMGAWIGLGLSLLLACQSPVREVEPAFYHWKSEFSLNAAEQEWIDTLGVRQLYVRLFDVDWDEASHMAIPLAEVNLQRDNWPSSTRLIPTVYLTNRTMLRISTAEIPVLAERMWKLIRQRSAGIPFREIQLDCDWSEKSQAAFFQLVEELKTRVVPDSLQLSATIRLHQIKYLELTGVPPVDRGMLMFYNMGDLRDPATTNSILDLETARGYLVNFDRYPIPLDLALPVFRWGVLIREGQPIRLINQLDPGELADTTRFDRRDSQRLHVRKSTYLNGLYLYQGDVIRLEQSSITQLSEAMDLLRPIWPTQRFRLSLYHLDSHNLSVYSHEQLAEIFHAFR